MGWLANQGTGDDADGVAGYSEPEVNASTSCVCKKLLYKENYNKVSADACEEASNGVV